VAFRGISPAASYAAAVISAGNLARVVGSTAFIQSRPPLIVEARSNENPAEAGFSYLSYKVIENRRNHLRYFGSESALVFLAPSLDGYFFPCSSV
jgi:hypothetical protein